jgi:hypothetical protein
MFKIIIAVIAGFIFFGFLEYVGSQPERAKKARYYESREMLYTSILSTYQEMKNDRDCKLLFQHCKSLIEKDDLTDVYWYLDKLVFHYRVETIKMNSWSNAVLSPKHREYDELQTSDFLETGLSDEGKAALLYWLVDEIPFMVFICAGNLAGQKQETKDLHVVVHHDCQVPVSCRTDDSFYSLAAIFHKHI